MCWSWPRKSTEVKLPVGAQSKKGENRASLFLYLWERMREVKTVQRKSILSLSNITFNQKLYTMDEVILVEYLGKKVEHQDEGSFKQSQPLIKSISTHVIRPTNKA